jgi:hypothetical protein
LAIRTKLGRTIEAILSKANRQFRSYGSRHPQKNTVRVCVILNSTLREWSPDVLIDAIHGKMKSGPDEPRFSHIDAVLYISEKHMRMLPDGRPAHGIVIYAAQGAIDHPWKMQFVDRIVDEWSHMRTGVSVLEGKDINFEVVEDIPEIMRHSETWQLEYRRDPYLQMLPVEQLRAMFQRTVAVNSLAFVKGSWPKPLHHAISEGLVAKLDYLEQCGVWHLICQDHHIGSRPPDVQQARGDVLPIPCEDHLASIAQ